jgi:hypothetical protein
MRVLLYARPENGDGERLEILLRRMAPHGSVDRFYTLGVLSRSVHLSSSEPCLAVLVAGSREELLDIATFRSALEGVQLLLVLPGEEREMINIAHQLRPRYVTHCSNGFADLLAVVERKLSPERGSRHRARHLKI